MNRRMITTAAVLLLAACATERTAKPVPYTRYEPVDANARPSTTQVPRVTTLGDAVKLCLARNTELDAAAARVRAARAGVERARAAMLPYIGAELSVLWADAPSVSLFKSIDAHSFSPTTNFNDPGSLQNTEAAIAGMWNLWRGGRDELNVRAAELGVQAGVGAESATRNAMIGAVVGAWHQHRAARELVAVDDARMATIEKQLSDARSRVAAGSALQVDVLALEVRLADARARRTSTELAQKLSLAALRELLALDDDTPIEPAAEPSLATQLPESLEAARSLAHQKRAELAAGQSALEAARTQLRAAERGWWPRLDLQARAWADDNHVGTDFGDMNSSLALALSFDAYDGGMRSSGVEAARAACIEGEARLRSSELAIGREVESAWLSRNESRARLDVAQAAERAAREALEIISSQVENGAASVSRYLDAEADLAQARGQRVMAEIDVQRAGFELLRAVGTLEEVTW